MRATPSITSLQARSILGFIEGLAVASVRDEVRRGLCRGLYLVVLNSVTFPMLPLVVKPGQDGFCQEPELMLTVLENAEQNGQALGGWPQYVEALWEELAPPERVADLAGAGYDELVPALVAVCAQEPGRSKLRQVAARVSTRSDFAVDLEEGFGVHLYPLESLFTADDAASA